MREGESAMVRERAPRPLVRRRHTVTYITSILPGYDFRYASSRRLRRRNGISVDASSLSKYQRDVYLVERPLYLHYRKVTIPRSAVMLFNSKKVNSTWTYSICILLMNMIFISCGALTFIWIEGTAEREERKEDLKTRAHLIDHIPNAQRVLPKLLDLQKEMCRKSNSRAGEKSWGYTGSLHFCMTIISTIGYGVASPHNTLSRSISVVYAMIGIPIYAVYLSYAYLGIARFLDKVAAFFFRQIRCSVSDLVKLCFKSFLANCVLWSYLLLLIYLWSPPENQKSQLDELYWQVIRFTSIGFGDEFRDVGELPAHIPHLMNMFLVAFLLLPFGISITSYYFQIYRKIFGNRRKWLGNSYKRFQNKCQRTLKSRLVRSTANGGAGSEGSRRNSSNSACSSRRSSDRPPITLEITPDTRRLKASVLSPLYSEGGSPSTNGHNCRQADFSGAVSTTNKDCSELNVPNEGINQPVGNHDNTESGDSTLCHDSTIETDTQVVKNGFSNVSNGNSDLLPKSQFDSIKALQE